MGRSCDYETRIKPHIDEIRKAVEKGATCEEIAKGLGITIGTLRKLKAENKELSEAFARGREEVCIQIKASLLKKALGYDYEEIRTSGKKDKNGEDIIMVEKYTRHMPPSETAAAMLLRNYDKKWLDKDNATTELRKKEYELRKAIADATVLSGNVSADHITINMDVKADE